MRARFFSGKINFPNKSIGNNFFPVRFGVFIVIFVHVTFFCRPGLHKPHFERGIYFFAFLNLGTDGVRLF